MRCDGALIAVFLTAPLLLAAGSNTAHALAACGERDAILKRLGDKFHETPIGVGLASNGGLMEIFIAADGATWTITLMMPDGRMCLMAVGTDWQHVEPVLAGEVS